MTSYVKYSDQHRKDTRMERRKLVKESSNNTKYGTKTSKSTRNDEDKDNISEKDSRLTRAGVSGYNKPKRTPGHKTKSHVVVAKVGSKVKTIRFGQQDVKTAGKPKKGESAKQKTRRKSFKARHAKNIAKGRYMTYWANKIPKMVGELCQWVKVWYKKIQDT